MRLVFGIVTVACLGLSATGLASPQENAGWGISARQALGQESAKPPADNPATQEAPATQPTAGVKKDAPVAPQAEPQPEPRTEPKKKVDSDAVSPNARRRAAGKRTPAPAPAGGSRKTVVREGGADEPTAQIVTGMAPEEANRQRQRAEELLKSTDETLKRIAPRALDARQQETVSQIHHYMEGARSALKEGDISRAHTLAVKAGLLAEDLEKHP